ncbi:MAG TPA: threonine--tRNA ligase, partial [Burkholderiales bacterium]
ARGAVAARVDGRLVDLSFVLRSDAALEPVGPESEEGLEVLRHSTAHLLAHAVQDLFPGTQVTIGPVIEDGFYYDFAHERGFTEDDLRRIEERMAEIVKRNYPVERTVMARDAAIDFFRKLGEEYKAKIIEAIPEGETLSLYRQGDFVDLCRGPHVPATGKLRAFKLMKTAGAYWRGDSKNEMLARIYGTAWADDKQLKEYLHRIEEADKRDHRKLGRQLDLFHMQEEAPGMVFWHENGWRLYQAVTQHMGEIWRGHGYREIRTPQLVDRSLWEQSGHWENFHADMFITESEKRVYAVKPMNCPCHVQVYNQGLKSYRDLPLRLAEFGGCHRNERSGSLHGIMRLRSFVQDDAHIFCTEAQMQAEILAFVDLLHAVYRDYGFTDVMYRLSTRPPLRLGSDAMWDRAEHALEAALNATGLPWQLQPGEGSFYGPKIEFSLKDSLGRVWQCGTIQVDYNMPERLGATYIAEDSSKKVPVMLHRAILGSIERFIGILIEEYAGAFPPWLAPVQAVVLTITDQQVEYAEGIAQALRRRGFRAEADLRNEKIGFKIREHTLQRVPYMLVCGKREALDGTLAVRTRKGEDLGSMSPEAFSERLTQEIASRGVNFLEEQKHRVG